MGQDKMVQDGLRWFEIKLVQYGLKRFKLVQDGSRGFKMV
jgi:hypothetical protein